MDSLEEQLFNAVSKGDVASVTCLLSQGANVNVVCSSGRTALGSAAEAGDTYMLKILLEANGVSTSMYDNDQDVQLNQKKHKGKKYRKESGAGAGLCKSDSREDESDMPHKSIGFELCRKNSLEEATGGTGKELEKSNLGYFIMVHGEGEDENLNLDVDAASVLNDMCTPDGMERLEWDTEVQGTCEKNTEADEDSWAALYRWYADILDRTGSLLQSAQQCDVNHQDVYGRSAVHYAAEHGHLEALRLLTSAVYNLEAMDVATKIASLSDMLNGCRLDVADTDNFTPLHLASARDHVGVVRMLLSAGVQVNRKTSDKTSALHIAASRGFTASGRWLLESGAAVDALDASDRTPLLLAVSRGHEDMARLLLQHGAKVNIEEVHGYTPLCEAVWQKMVPLVQLLLDAGAKVTQSHFLLHDAVMNRHTDMVQLLLRAGSIVNLRDDNGDTPLIVASRTGHQRVAQMLLENGASVNYSNSLTGSMPLHEAVEYIRASQFETFEAMFKLFLSYGVELDVQTFTGGDTPLFRAVLLERPRAAALLIQHGADVNLGNVVACVVDNLTLAVMRGNLPLVQMLVYAGFNLRQVSDDPRPAAPESVQAWVMHMKRNAMRLTDLCRIAIRRILGANLHGRVDELFLPATLKTFLLLEDISV